MLSYAGNTMRAFSPSSLRCRASLRFEIEFRIRCGAPTLNSTAGKSDPEDHLDNFARRQKFHPFSHRRFISLHAIYDLFGKAHRGTLDIGEAFGIDRIALDSVDLLLRRTDGNRDRHMLNPFVLAAFDLRDPENDQLAQLGGEL